MRISCAIALSCAVRTGAFAPRARAFHRAVTVQAVSELTVGQLKALFDGEDVITKAVLSKDSIQMVDVRETDELMVANYPTPGMTGERPMKHLPLSTMNQWADSALDGSILDKTKPVLVACKSGGRSMQLCRWLDENGFSDVYNLRGGINAYSALDRKTGGPY